nr:excalibur calcium-binding domain-containing protein [Arenimonas caeni]
MSALLLASPQLAAHSGGTNADGCHTNRKTGEYHCHAPKAKPSAASPSANTPRPLAARAGSSVYYANCTEARNAGAAPVRRGDPGYGSHLDRDNDGVGCE